MTQPSPSRPRTIGAIATPLGQGGVGIVRLSGPGALSILERLFRPASSSFTGFVPRHMHFGHVLDEAGRILDEVLAVFMPGPHSYTGEDVAEIHCHGGPAVLSGVLEGVMACGADPAGPGEFTRRAFLNGRLDLSQAEAVAELISAPNRAAAFLARTRLAGGVGKKTAELRGALEQLRQGVALAVDFPDEDVDCLSPEDFETAVLGVLEDVEQLLATRERTRTWREGALVVLTGKVNAGKSSLMNALLGRRRAIVTDCPGTTRDYLEEQLVKGNMSLRLVDTAGLRSDGDVVEMEGMRYSRDLAESADVAVVVVDATSLPGGREEDLAEERALVDRVGRERVVAVMNKADLLEGQDARKRGLALLEERLGRVPGAVAVSARQGEGLEDLLAAIAGRIVSSAPEPSSSELSPNLRQSLALARVRDDLRGLVGDIRGGATYDVLGVVLESACAGLEEITGRIAPDDVLNAIFDDFCIGK